MKNKEEILKEFETYYCLSSIMDIESQNEIKQFLIKALAQTREETIKEVEEEIESWEKEDGKSFTSDKIKNILNKLKQ